MYALLWSILPGPWWVRVILLALLLALALAALVVWVFPAVDALIAPQDVTVEEGASALGMRGWTP